MHLYCGLALVPWVLLYAVSGMLFNHPDWSAPGRGPTRFTLSELEAVGSAEVLDAQAAALAVAAALGDGVELEASPPPRLRSRLHAKRTDGSDELWLRFPSRRGSWGTRIETTPRVPATLGDIGHVDVPNHDAAAWQSFADAVASRVEGAPATTELDRAPTLRFHARIDGETWEVDYDPKSGDVSFEAVADREVRLPRLLARLHMTHVYPDTLGVAWLHALIVDLTALCLVMWCLTGLFMWWQMRKVRVIGWVVIASGLVLTLALLIEVIPLML